MNKPTLATEALEGIGTTANPMPPIPTAPEATTLANPSLDGFNFAVDTDGITAPRIRLLQPTRFDERFNAVESGHFVNVATGEDLGTVLRAVVLGVQPSRARFAGVDAGGDLLCRSADAKTGTGDPGGPCEFCPYAKWGKGRTPPECGLAYNYFILPVGGDGAVSAG